MLENVYEGLNARICVKGLNALVDGWWYLFLQVWSTKNDTTTVWFGLFGWSCDLYRVLVSQKVILEKLRRLITKTDTKDNDKFLKTIFHVSRLVLMCRSAVWGHRVHLVGRLQMCFSWTLVKCVLWTLVCKCVFSEPSFDTGQIYANPLCTLDVGIAPWRNSSRELSKTSWSPATILTPSSIRLMYGLLVFERTDIVNSAFCPPW